MLQPPALGMTTRETENRERDGETTGQPDGNQTALKEWYNSDLDRIVEYLASEISREDPNHYNAPTIPFPPFRNACQIPPETHFFPPRHAADGLSSEILHYLMNQDRTPEGLLRLLLVHQVPIERLQVPFSDENITPEDLCTSFHCPITVERKSCAPFTIFARLFILENLDHSSGIRSFHIMWCWLPIRIENTDLTNP